MLYNTDEEWPSKDRSGLTDVVQKKTAPSRFYQVIREGDDGCVEIRRRKGKGELHPALKWGLEVPVRHRRRLLGPVDQSVAVPSS